MRLLHRFKFAGLVAALSLMLGACATTSPPEQLVEARASYQKAQQSNAAKYAPTELAQAKKALLTAEKQFQETGDEEITRTLAYIAKRRSQEAMAQGKVNFLVTTRQAKQSELLARTESMREQYQRQLIRQRQMAQMNEQQLEQKRQELEQAREELEDQGMTAEQLRQREREYAAAISKLEVEIERRKKAEQQLQTAMNKLEDIAEVRQEDGRGQVITLDNSVLFEVGQSELLPNARQRLKQVADVLQMQEDRKIVIEGHTDAQGSDQLNQRLSRERAQSVKDFLVSRGVDASRVQTVGYGEDRPIATNRTVEGRAMNRRVEIVLPTAEAVGGGPDQQKQQQQREQDEQMQQQEDMEMQQQEQEGIEMQQDQEGMEMQQEDMEMQQQEQEGIEMQEEEGQAPEQDTEADEFEVDDFGE
ncbi:DUF4398 domain-containing protein [Persicimonas caeni]|uniref:DUF4398 domain-containing protein n=1 Tax=Persicimonas caeni TaxID=2292766 RepID=A0A4Y6PMZ0_PERCE|nr:OmpA family protein [Persicimonas caeni]QDG49573.1 DUF4398 domain-containing protein [Persicimonas caeni]QED30794.1 OmpA family protein [Persicimonas caeni]